jgi:hypothetical protein
MDYKKTHFVSSRDKLPAMPHLAVLQFGSVTIPGDERSRTHPGHGYPEHSQATVEYIAFDDQTALKTWIESHERFGRKDDYVVINVAPVTLERKLEIRLAPILAAVAESNKRMNSYTEEERAQLEREARERIAEGARRS